MAMPRSDASLIPDHDDSVENENENENEKDFAHPPPKKLKGEEDNSSIPMSQDPDDSVAREAFERWCRLFRAKGRYPTDAEKELRFKYFKDSLGRKVDNPFLELFGVNAPHFADRNEDEFDDLTFGCAVYCSISPKLLDEMEEYDLEVKEEHGIKSFPWN